MSNSRSPCPETQSPPAELLQRMQKRLEVEAYFARSGRTLRKSRSRLFFNQAVKPKLIKAALQTVGLYGRGKKNALRPRVHEVDFMVRTLPPALHGFTILQISDLHLDKIDGLSEALVPLLEPLRPDICVFTGDFRFEIRGSCSEIYPRLEPILRAIHPRYGTFGILGNHDPAEVANWLAFSGVTMLINDAEEIHHNGASIWLAGIDDPHDYRCDDLDGALAPIPPGAFKILLAHTPSLFREASEKSVDLYLCGHTHAGQIRLPGIGALKKNGSFPRDLVQDAWVFKGMQGYTSWGAGCSTLPVRFNCPPEVALIRLQTTP